MCLKCVIYLAPGQFMKATVDKPAGFDVRRQRNVQTLNPQFLRKRSRNCCRPRDDAKARIGENCRGRAGDILIALAIEDSARQVRIENRGDPSVSYGMKRIPRERTLL